jgi:hypothetical protein
LFARQRLEHIAIESVAKNIDWSRHTLVLDTLLPITRKGENAIGVTVQDINKGLKLRIIDLVHIDPDLEIARNTRLANLL